MFSMETILFLLKTFNSRLIESLGVDQAQDCAEHNSTRQLTDVSFSSWVDGVHSRTMTGALASSSQTLRTLCLHLWCCYWLHTFK